MLIDTHCHIHESDYPLDIETTLKNAKDSDVSELLCVGTNIDSSIRAIAFAKDYSGTHATIGVHPHDTKDGWEELADIIKTNGIVAIGEIGLDYFYNHSDRKTQIKALKWQIELAVKNNLPIVFHVRDAFDDFWPILDTFQTAGHQIRGVLHSFTDNQQNLEEGLKRGLYIGVNGISTFTKDKAQQELFASIPLASLLLETDAPFLTPAPFRGQTNEPAFVKNIAEYHAKVRGISFEEVCNVTTANARALFGL
ncbi:TatD family hydrolase [soil metagenome]